MSGSMNEISLSLRQTTYDNLTVYKDENTMKDYSSAIDDLLHRVVRKRRQQRVPSKKWKIFMILFRLTLLGLGVYLTFQILFFLWFPVYQVPLRDKETKRVLFYGDPQIEGSARVKKQGLYGSFQNMYNDFYMKWIFMRNMAIIQPDMVVLLGDLVSSQHISYVEFHQRVLRLRWIFALPEGHEDVEMVWLAGNHDVGYGSDCTKKRMERFEKEFGEQNRFFEAFGHDWLMFNSQVLDGSRVEQLHKDTVSFLEQTGIEYLKTTGTPEGKPLIILDHIPFYKPKGHCFDSPRMEKDKDGYVESQTMLSLGATSSILRYNPMWIFNGHDHNGCFYEHKLGDKPAFEVTVRSIMGDYGGYSNVLDITPQPHTDPKLRKEYDYHLFTIGFFTTTELITKFFVFVGWAVLAFCQIVSLLCCGTKKKLKEE